MTREEVLKVARSTVEKQGWPWEEPVLVKRERKFVIVGAILWHVTTNANYRGANANVWIDDKTGRVVSKAFAPR